MPTESTITCPQCAHEFKLNEMLAAPLLESTRRDFERQLAEKDARIATREQTLKSREEALAKEKEAAEARVQEMLKKERAAIAADESKKAKLLLGDDLDKKARELADLQEVLKERNEKLLKAQQAEGDLIRARRELDDARREMTLTIDKQVQAELGKAREHAKKEFDEQLARKLQEKDETLASMQAQLAEVAKREQAIKAREATLATEKAALEQQLEQKLQAERTKIVADEARKAKLAAESDLNLKTQELAELQEVIKLRDQRLAEAQKAQIELMQKQREFEAEKREMDLTIEKRIQENLASTREQAKKEVEEQIGLKVAEKEQTISSLQRHVDDLKRKLEQGSQQTQGEVLELQLEALLASKFPHDRIEPVPKGEHGGDILHRIFTPMGTPCGTILWESKRTKNWSDGWLTKLREDQRVAKAEAAIVVSAALPRGVESFDQIDGVWVTHPRNLLPVALAIRQLITQVNGARQASEGQQTKMAMVYQYLMGDQFKLRVEAIVEAFKTMREDLESEKRAIQKAWAKRDKQIEVALGATIGMYGDLQGIAGKTMREIDGLDVKLIGDADGEKE